MTTQTHKIAERVRALPEVEKLALVDEILADLVHPDPAMEEVRKRWLAHAGGTVTVLSCRETAGLYADGERFGRITVRPEQMGGVPCIRGLRIPVATVVGMVAEGMTGAEILAAYPDLQKEDIREALRYAAEAVRERALPLAATA